VGIAAAQGVAIALTCPALALPSILAVPTAHEGAPCLAIGDARRGSFWSSRMENFCLSTPPSLCDSQELITLVANAASEGIPVVSFDHPERFPLPHPLASLVTQEFPNAARLWHAWVHAPETARRTWRSHIPQPLYLKPPHITPAKRPNSLRP
jgi:tRNA A37 threonylcarbamoyladenosine modification protein TsaB